MSNPSTALLIISSSPPPAIHQDGPTRSTVRYRSSASRRCTESTLRCCLIGFGILQRRSATSCLFDTRCIRAGSFLQGSLLRSLIEYACRQRSYCSWCTIGRQIYSSHSKQGSRWGTTWSARGCHYQSWSFAGDLHLWSCHGCVAKHSAFPWRGYLLEFEPILAGKSHSSASQPNCSDFFDHTSFPSAELCQMCNSDSS